MAHLRLLATVMALSAIPAVNASTTNDAKATEAAAEAMARINTFGHPDQFYEGDGMQAYVAHSYVHAMKEFKRAARFADKLSQLSIGLMYMNGEGVAKDPVTAYAWISLSAERNYPAFLATRDQLGKQLSAAQLSQAQAVLADLQKEYGDAVAKPRMAHELGYALRTADPSGTVDQGTYTATGGAADRTTVSCGPFGGRDDCGFYASWRWNPREYFAARDAQWTHPIVGKVIVMPLQQEEHLDGPIGQLVH